MDWFLYDHGLRHEKVENIFRILLPSHITSLYLFNLSLMTN